MSSISATAYAKSKGANDDMYWTICSSNGDEVDDKFRVFITGTIEMRRNVTNEIGVKPLVWVSIR